MHADDIICWLHSSMHPAMAPSLPHSSPPHSSSHFYFLSSKHTPQHTHHYTQTHTPQHTPQHTYMYTTSPVGGNHSKDISCNPRPNGGTWWCATVCGVPLSTKEVCTLPTEAQLKNQPYPFGLDPVSLRWDWGLASVNSIGKK